ncbi:MAG: tRNA (guanosine(37)-N1)-methyltransferase TrmD [Deltaproteobacteria bacterium]|nr:MAG: tRNA (guanosine(37)-N1)-methyltransferase TrmD [Deltaproteobacteria bacterium]
MRVHVLTLFPEMFGSPLAAGVLRRARERGALEVSLHQLRDYAGGRHLQVDDTPYGGGQGMVMKPEPLVAAIEHIAAADAPRRILLSPQGAAFSHERARALASERSLLLLCARYEGLDERVKRHVDEELSIGDYVLSGGELAALVVLDAVARLLPGVLGNVASPADDSFATGLLEHPQYTRPEEFRGVRVPDVLLSGEHAAIARWRREQSLRLTLERRPDLLARAPLDATDRAFLRTLGWEQGDE